MNKKIKEYLERIKANSNFNYKNTFIIGGVLMAVGTIGFIPSVALGMPYIAEKLEIADEKSTNSMDKEKEIKLENLSGNLVIDMLECYPSNIKVVESQKEYSYIKIENMNYLDIKAEVSTEKDFTNILFEEEYLEGNDLKYKVGMSVDEGIQLLADSFVMNNGGGYTIEIGLAKDVNLEVKNYNGELQLDDVSLIKELKVSSTNFWVSEKTEIESLKVISNNDILTLDGQRIGAFNNIDISFEENISDRTRVTIVNNNSSWNNVNTIDIKADMVTIDGIPSGISKELNLDIQELEIFAYNDELSNKSININTKEVNELIYRTSIDGAKVNDYELPKVQEGENFDPYNYRIWENDSNLIKLGSGEDNININLKSDVQKISIT